ncbi:MAG TPA: alanine racemase [Acholeplasmataceae bacterium]|nr:alanine racemase [Acholeplasmataceae bacterium]
MSEIYRQTWAEVNLDNLVDNYQNIKLLMGNKTIIPVIKANAYGHGDIKVMERLYKEGVRICAVSLLEEAIKIRKRFPDIIIIMLGPVLENDLKVCSSKEIDITIYNQEIYNLIINFEGKLNCQFKVDTGMSRYGIKDFDLVVRMVNTLMSKTNINLRGIYTHFATAEDNKEFYNKQVKMMQLVLSKLKKVPSMVHMSNSASILQYEKDFDFTTHVRLGISLYGSLPIVSEFKLKPVMKLYSKIVQIKKLTQGDSLGYGITYRPKKDVYIAIIPIGYADGLWKAYKRGYVEIKGKKYKIVGTICMGACFIKVNEEIKVGDIVTIFGGLISIEEMGLILKTNSYEVLTAISYRVPRVYREEKK